jgi:hypothetical protein
MPYLGQNKQIKHLFVFIKQLFNFAPDLERIIHGID